jgi:hypothetical protein
LKIQTYRTRNLEEPDIEWRRVGEDFEEGQGSHKAVELMMLPLHCEGRFDQFHNCVFVFRYAQYAWLGVIGRSDLFLWNLLRGEKARFGDELMSPCLHELSINKY